MNIQRKEIDIQLNGKNYIAVIDFGAAIEFEGLTGKSIITEIEEVTKTQSMRTLAYLMASVIKTKDNKSIGVEEISKIDLVGGMSYFIDKMAELLDNSLPKEEGNEENKKKIEKKAKKQD